MSQVELNSWIKSSYNPVSATEDLAEEVLVSGPNLAFEGIDLALKKAQKDNAKY